MIQVIPIFIYGSCLPDASFCRKPPMVSADLFPERYKRKKCHLEMLQAERYPYYGNAAYESENQMDGGNFYSEDQNPYDVHDD